MHGSSPLTRGKLRDRAEPQVVARLIPAHAGKTTFSRKLNGRSDGLSPLTRGKRSISLTYFDTVGLIPAHAGKTRHPRVRACCWAAHPRSRGENLDPRSPRADAAGSSPLTRGKPVIGRDTTDPRRLIPAHAGKTCAPGSSSQTRAAHPRSRGENIPWGSPSGRTTGSSPLTRGKLISMILFSLVIGLIPAHAGKTTPDRRSPSASWAHPRSRGENSVDVSPPVGDGGSSPLTRGKPRRTNVHTIPRRLIPAHAGKTAE